MANDRKKKTGPAPEEQAAEAEAPVEIEKPEAALAEGESGDDTAAPRQKLPPERLRSIVESLLFVNGRPMTAKDLAAAIPEVTKKELEKLLAAWVKEDVEAGRGIRIVSVATGYQVRTIPENAAWIRRLSGTRLFRLTQPALEVLSITAYKQPVTRAEIDEIRGVDSSATIRALQERKFLRIVGTKEVPGHPSLLGTTPEFLEFFGLESLEQMPPLREILEQKSEAIEEPAGEPVGPFGSQITSQGLSFADLEARLPPMPDLDEEEDEPSGGGTPPPDAPPVS